LIMEYATVSAARCVSRGHTTIPEFNATCSYDNDYEKREKSTY